MYEYENIENVEVGSVVESTRIPYLELKENCM